MKIHDVSLVLRPDMVTWPGEPSPKIEPLRRIARGDTANVSVVTISDHAGTHVDPPLHFLEGGNTADKLPVAALVGPCVVTAFDGPGHVSAEWLDRAKLPAKRERWKLKLMNLNLYRFSQFPVRRMNFEIAASNANGRRPFQKQSREVRLRPQPNKPDCSSTLNSFAMFSGSGKPPPIPPRGAQTLFRISSLLPTRAVPR